MAVKTSWSSGDVLTAADLTDTFAAKLDASAAVGKVLQIVRATDSTDRTTTSTSAVDITGMSVTITPTSATSNILVMATFCLYLNSGSVSTRGRVLITDSANNVIGGGQHRWAQATVGGGAPQPIWGVTLVGYASPATTSATTYKLRWFVDTGTTATLANAAESAGQIFAIEVGA